MYFGKGALSALSGTPFIGKSPASGLTALKVVSTLTFPSVDPSDGGGGGAVADSDLSTPTNGGEQRTWIGATTGTVYGEDDNPAFLTLERNPTGRKTRYRKTWDELAPDGKQARVNHYDKAIADGDLPAPTTPNATGAAAAAAPPIATPPGTDPNKLMREVLMTNSKLLHIHAKQLDDVEGAVLKVTDHVTEKFNALGEEMQANFAITTKTLEDAAKNIVALQQSFNAMDNRQVKIEAIVKTNSGDILLVRVF